MEKPTTICKSFSMLASVILMTTIYPIYAQSWDLIQKLGSSDQEAADNLGISVGISGSYMIAGAWWEEGEDGSNGPVNSAGSAYIYKLQQNGTWVETQKLISPNREALGYYGFYVAIDGDFALVGAYNEDHSGGGNAGRVYAYHRDVNDVWVLDGELSIDNPGNNDYFGRNLAIAGEYALIGAYGHDLDENDANSLNDAGAAFLYKRQSNNTWELKSKLVAFDRAEADNFGKYVDIDEQGLVIGAFKKNQNVGLLETGAAYGISCDVPVCDFDGVSTADLKKFRAPDQNSFESFGWDVAISGNWAVAGKSGESDQPGGGTGSGTGAAYFFHWENGNWVGKQKVFAPDFSTGARFGRAIAMDGPVCVIGAGTEAEDANGQNTLFGAGAAYVFELQNNDQWMPVQKLAGTKRGVNDLFAEDAVDLDGIRVVVGAWLADTINAGEVIDGGAVYIFERDSPITAIEDITGDMPITIFNNPSADGWLHLQRGEGTIEMPVGIQIISIDGIVWHQENSLTGKEWNIDASNLMPGIYFVHLNGKGFLPKTLKWIRM